MTLRSTSIPNPIGLSYASTNRGVSCSFRFFKPALDNVDIDTSKVIVLHPGSETLKFGMATEGLPRTIPNVIARLDPTKGDTMEAENKMDVSSEIENNEDIDKHINIMKESIKSRLQQAQLREVPNADTIISNFNQNSKPEKRIENNDSIQFEGSSKPQIIIGNDVKAPYKVINLFERKYPTELNNASFAADLEAIWAYAIEKHLEINPKEFKYLRVASRTILDLMGFKAVLFMQESVAATYGAGVSVGLVVDIGAQGISVACVEEGCLSAKSRVHVPIGGEDMTCFLFNLLKQAKFPGQEMNIHDHVDFDLLDEIKTKHATLSEKDLNVHLVDVQVKGPEDSLFSYKIKTYDQFILSSMMLFYPDVLKSIQLRHQLSFPNRESPNFDVYLNPDQILSAGKKKSRKKTVHSSPDKSVDYEKEDLSDDENSDIEPFSERDSILPHKEEVIEKTNIFEEETFKCQNCEFEGIGLSSILSHVESEHILSLEQKTDKIYEFVWGDEHLNFASLPSIMGYVSRYYLLKSTGNKPSDTENAPTEQTIPAIDEAIIQSLGSLVNLNGNQIPERGKRLLNSILLVGGVSKIYSLAEFLKSRLATRFKEMGYSTQPSMEVLVSSKDMDPKYLSWKGATILAKIDSSKEFWISGEDWHNHELKSLQAKCIFPIN
ncbi:Actin-related protein domain-containing protein [Rozella allomycis CSF55]|uniref:Actin-related protein domain-containing protein n=1 Tax=Rozella allomycis (strain CSF55) TaxID=988480 RepID=A0A075AWM4_ROZAC|nr:Actin-related protein domain-containing protein [Rozella allomycis CSF55]|eukprot:EPZ34735.1 Actin-related protein domain-containing protein [Rozella allomycis CSF55]